MKKVFTLVSMVLAFGLMGCGDSNESKNESAKSEVSQSKQSKSGDNIAVQNIRQDEPTNKGFEPEPLCEKIDRSELLWLSNDSSGRILRVAFGIDTFNMTPQQIQDLLLSHLGANGYFMGIKRNSKESLCAYTLTFDYLKTEITEDELLRFEQFLAQNQFYSQYEQSEGSKNMFLNIYKFLKYNNKIEEMYQRGYDYFKDILIIGDREHLERIAIQHIYLKRMVLGVFQKDKVYGLPSIRVTEMEAELANIIDKCPEKPEADFEDYCKIRDGKEFKAIIAWVKSVNEGKGQRSEVLSFSKNTLQSNVAESTTNSSQNSAAPSPAPSVASASDKLPSIKLATKDDYVNLRKAPSGEILTPIYKKDFDKITIKKLDGGNDKWLKVLYFPPNETDESKAITGYIHNSQIAK